MEFRFSQYDTTNMTPGESQKIIDTIGLEEFEQLMEYGPKEELKAYNKLLGIK